MRVTASLGCSDMAVAYFDCFSGAGGDMIVGALVDAGACPTALQEALSGLGLSGYSLSIGPVKKGGFAATRFEVQLDPRANQPARKLADIQQLIQNSTLSDSVKAKSLDIFAKLAATEAKVHGSSIDQVHFHEVGAVDAILDIVGSVAALEMLGVAHVYCSPIPVGSGTVTCQHGRLPVPAPATAELLKDVPVVAGSQACELTTPTAAAVLTTLAVGFGPVPPMTLKSVGYGAGSRNGEEPPNLLRVMLGQTLEIRETDCVTVLESCIDDASPEIIGHCLERLLEGGALDAFVQPIQMKKWRSGVLVTVLCESQMVERMEGILFAETTTLGIRRRSDSRTRLRRRIETVETAFGPIRVKIGEGNGVVTASPEFDDCKNAARKRGVAVREVLDAAKAAWRAARGS